MLEEFFDFVGFIVNAVFGVFLALALSFALLLGFVWLFYGSSPDPLMQKCMADGHKDYECVGILRGQR